MNGNLVATGNRPGQPKYSSGVQQPPERLFRGYAPRLGERCQALGIPWGRGDG